jgi:prevent-host-death family protein
MTMTRRVSVSELKSRLSEYLRGVRRGQVVLVTDRDRVVARLEGAGPVPRDAGDERVTRLEASGVLRRRTRRIDPALLDRRVQVDARVVSAVLEERDEGR